MVVLSIHPLRLQESPIPNPCLPQNSSNHIHQSTSSSTSTVLPQTYHTPESHNSCHIFPSTDSCRISKSATFTSNPSSSLSLSSTIPKTASRQAPTCSRCNNQIVESRLSGPYSCCCLSNNSSRCDRTCCSISNSCSSCQSTPAVEKVEAQKHTYFPTSDKQNTYTSCCCSSSSTTCKSRKTTSCLPSSYSQFLNSSSYPGDLTNKGDSQKLSVKSIQSSYSPPYHSHNHPFPDSITSSPPSPIILEAESPMVDSYSSPASNHLPFPLASHSIHYYFLLALVSLRCFLKTMGLDKSSKYPSNHHGVSSSKSVWSDHYQKRAPSRERQQRWMLMSLILMLSYSTPAHAQVVGENMRCHQEGEAVTVPKEVLKDNPCLECVCENGIVVCNKVGCPSLEGCYWKLPTTQDTTRSNNQSLDDCCQKCKGCEFEGKMYQHKAKWSDGCNHYACLSGVLTVSETQCHTPCYLTMPLQPKKCCQKCQGCWFEGRRIPEGETVSSQSDKCISCKCSSGNMSCEKKSCPVLSCPPIKQVLAPGSCCKTCNGSRYLISPPGGRCFLNGHLYQTGTERTLDPCTVCECQQGYITCQRRTCPVLNCSREFQILMENECCPICSAAAELETVCRVPGMVRKDGEHWKLDECTSCECQNGETSCRIISCEYINKPCPAGYRRVKKENECCPQCEKAPGVCAVFGDPHYLTFDGLLFNFQGACKYVLAKTCRGKDFNLKVNNDARRSTHFSWTKSLLLSIPGAKVKLGQKLRTKVNGDRVRLPYNLPNVLNITREGYALKISTEYGVQVLWDGVSYVELEVPLELQSKVCGLCGNFNGNVSDDLTTVDGTIADTPDRMAMSWSTGKVRKCSRKMREMHNKERNDLERKRQQRQNCPVSLNGLTKCAILNSTAFMPCHKAIPIDRFYESCIQDMCECKSSRRCECDTIQAYARLCDRIGIPIADWWELSKCGGMECPRGAEYMKCAPPCQPSCRNPTNPSCYTHECSAGCFCPPRTVLHRGSCIPRDDCPRKSRKRHRKS